MNKELFVSSTPHETKVGMVEDDLLAEVYLERENEYTLAGSIYKGRVTRVLPGMQSAFVDIGLERDAFLYVSDFMELEEHDDDLTDVIPATRAVPDLRQPAARAESAPGAIEPLEIADGSETDLEPESDQGFVEAESQPEGEAPMATAGIAEPAGDSQNRDRGSFRGRRRRRGGRRDGRSDGRDRGSERGPERAPDRGSDRSLEGTEQRGPDRAPETNSRSRLRPGFRSWRATLLPPLRARTFPLGGFGTRPALGPASWLPANGAARGIDFQIPTISATAARAGTVRSSRDRCGYASGF